jgi:hypothetical protein
MAYVHLIVEERSQIVGRLIMMYSLLLILLVK